MVHRAKRNHDIDHGSYLHLLHRRHRQRAGQSDERTFHPGVLQCNTKLRGRDHHDLHHRYHAYIGMYQRGSHCLTSALVVCSRSRIAILLLAHRHYAGVLKTHDSTVFSSLRAYVLSKNKPLGLLVLALSVTPIGVNLVSVSMLQSCMHERIITGSIVRI